LIDNTVDRFPANQQGKWLNRKFRITSTNDFQRVRHSGKRYAHPLVMIIVGESKDENSHVGIITGKSVGNAVKRNLARRRIREILNGCLIQFKQPHDIVVIARPSIDNAQYLELNQAINGLLKKDFGLTRWK
jgi:ribonuclease P protein component